MYGSNLWDETVIHIPNALLESMHNDECKRVNVLFPAVTIRGGLSTLVCGKPFIPIWRIDGEQTDVYRVAPRLDKHGRLRGNDQAHYDRTSITDYSSTKNNGPWWGVSYDGGLLTDPCC